MFRHVPRRVVVGAWILASLAGAYLGRRLP